MSLNMLMSFLWKDRQNDFYITVFCIDFSKPLADPVNVAYKADGVDDLFETLNSLDTNYFAKQVIGISITQYLTENGEVPGLDITISNNDYNESMGRYVADYPFRDC